MSLAIRFLSGALCLLWITISRVYAQEQTTPTVPPMPSRTTGTDTSRIETSHIENVPNKSTLQNMVSLDVARLFGYYNISFMRAISPEWSIGGQIEAPSNIFTGFLAIEFGFGGRVEGRYNFSKSIASGFYLAPVVGVNSSMFRLGSVGNMLTNNLAERLEIYTTWVSVGAVAGYQLALVPDMPGFVFGVGLGVEYNVVTTTLNGTVSGFTIPDFIPRVGVFSPVYPRLRATIGYAW